MALDICEILRVARVAGEHDAEARMLDDKAAPERFVAIPQGSRAPVLGWREMHDESRIVARVPPIHLVGDDAQIREPPLESQRHIEPRRAAGLPRKLFDRWQVEVVVM